MVDAFGVNKMARAVAMTPHPELPYMTLSEYNVMNDLIAAGQLSTFRLDKCVRVGCNNDVVKSKKWCSKRCWGHDNNQPMEVEDGDDDDEE